MLPVQVSGWNSNNDGLVLVTHLRADGADGVDGLAGRLQLRDGGGGVVGRHDHRHAVARNPVILVSIDGFRADYLERGVSPTLNQLAAGGVRAEAMRPSFPSVTFPNHYTLVTGLRPDHHGLVDNTMLDPAIPGERFTLSNNAAVADRRWWDQAEPVWVTAERNGLRSATIGST